MCGKREKERLCTQSKPIGKMMVKAEKRKEDVVCVCLSKRLCVNDVNLRGDQALHSKIITAIKAKYN